ncbi:protoporphyrinogen oxidase [Paenibacillus alkalitolerans]|uniref:protoporphyrinogen oxidase n=1 Tax=Paenibacillus alkalitolerans TaxID=2799335 RepID=UPI0018F6D187|nr:protoporphyrinogen oxidase [Paenibacillus alkalitolerans]
MADERTAAKVVVVGGGITGLSAAYYAVKAFREAGRPVEVTLLEASERLGGKVETLRRDGFVIERGPDSFLARKLAVIELSKELGLESELVRTNPSAKKTYILFRGKLHLIPQGLVLGIPTRWMPFVTSGLISLAGKMRAALDLVLPGAKKAEDESLGGFLKRRLGRQVVERIAEPLLSGVYAGDADRLSLLATFPQFRAIENKYGSLIAGMSRGAGATRTGSSNEEMIPESLRGSVFLSYRRGISALVEKLAATIDEIGVEVRTGTQVKRIRNNGGRPELLLSADGSALQADAVIVTAPAPALAGMIPDVTEAESFKEMRYASVANIVLVYRREDVQQQLEGSGFVVPKIEGRFITACTWTSSKWEHVAPENKAVIRCYVGRSDDERWLGMSDDRIISEVRRDIAELTGIRAEPEYVEINRLPRSMPQYAVGHVEQVKSLREALRRDLPGVFVAGAAYEGVGLPDCIRQAQEAVRAAADYVSFP